MFFPNEIKSSIEKSKKDKSFGTLFRGKSKKDDTTKKDKETKKSNITNVEKIRYEKIGKSFVVGGHEYFSSFYLKIKFQEIKKAKEKFEKITSNFSFKDKDKKEFKEKKKLSKAKVITKFALFAGVLGVTGYLVKKTYDGLANFIKSLNIFKYLDYFTPVSLKYHSKGNKFIDGEEASYVITTKSGDEISISEKSERNDIEDAAKNIDNLLINDFFGKKGLDGFLNPIDIASSSMGYMAFKPLSFFINGLNYYFSNSIKNPKIDSYLQSVYWEVSWLCDLIADKVLSSTYRGRYSNIILSSQEGYTNVLAKISNSANDMLNLTEGGRKNAYGFRVESGYKDGVKLFIGEYENTHRGDKRNAYILLPDAKMMSKRIKKMIETHSMDEIMYITGDTSVDSNEKQSFWIGKGDRTGKSLTTISSNFYLKNEKYEKVLRYLGNDGPDNHHVKDEIRNYINIAFSEEGRLGLYVGRIDKDEAHQEEYEELVKNIGPGVEKLETYLEKEIFPLIMEAKVRKSYIDDVLKNRDKLVEKLVKEKINFLKIDFDNSIIEENIYKNEISTKEKMGNIVRAYFSRASERNIFIKYIKILENEFNMVINEMYTLFDRFSTAIFPFAGLNVSNEDYKDDFGKMMMNFHKGSTYHISEYNEYGASVSLSDVIYMEKLSSFSKTRLNFRKKKIKRLYDTVVGLKNILKSNKKSKFRDYDTKGDDIFNSVFFLAVDSDEDGKNIYTKTKSVSKALSDLNKIKIPNESKIKGY